MNPYSEEPVSQMASATDLFGNFRLVPTKKRETERGQLLLYFSQKLGRPIGYVAMKCTALSVSDLYSLKSRCDQDTGRTYTDKEGNEKRLAWSQIWHQELKPRLTDSSSTT